MEEIFLTSSFFLVTLISCIIYPSSNTRDTFAFELFIQNPFEAIGYLFLGLLYAVGTTIAFIMTIRFLVKDLNQLVKKDSSN